MARTPPHDGTAGLIQAHHRHRLAARLLCSHKRGGEVMGGLDVKV